MRNRLIVVAMVLCAAVATMWSSNTLEAAGKGQPTDWSRFYYYPYVYYPHNFKPQNQTYDHMYYRYAPERRIPVYNKNWYNFYPTERPYHMGHHFILDVF